jgi:hypothetical protein
MVTTPRQTFTVKLSQSSLNLREGSKFEDSGCDFKASLIPDMPQSPTRTIAFKASNKY